MRLGGNENIIIQMIDMNELYAWQLFKLGLVTSYNLVVVNLPIKKSKLLSSQSYPAINTNEFAILT